MESEEESSEFYLRYYVGHKGKFGHEFLEFEFRPDGKLRYANNSNYKNDTIIRKEVYLTPAVLRECRRIIADSEIMKEDDNNWPEPDRVGRQELEIVMGNEHISFTTSKIGSLVDVQSSADPEGLRIFYYLVQVGQLQYSPTIILKNHLKPVMYSGGTSVWTQFRLPHQIMSPGASASSSVSQLDFMGELCHQMHSANHGFSS